MLRTYKEGQWLVFCKDGQVAKYNLANHTMIGFSGRPVHSLDTQLGRISVSDLIASIPDERYKQFVRIVHERMRNRHMVLKASTLLGHLRDYAWIEQYVTAGINSPPTVHIPIASVPKPLIAFARDNTDVECITQSVIDVYKLNPDACNTVFKYDGRLNAQDKVCILSRAASLDTMQRWAFRQSFWLVECVETYGYRAVELVSYLDYIVNHEALSIREALQNLIDYQRMSIAMGGKWDRYPRYLLSTHQITTRNYQRIRQQYDEQQFRQRIKPWMECTIDKYSFIYPQSASAIKDEGIQQHNCVSSYIDEVIRGMCDIVFMRDANTPDVSLVTIEVRNGCNIQQAYQNYNRPITNEQSDVLYRWAQSLPRRRAEYNKEEHAS